MQHYKMESVLGAVHFIGMLLLMAGIESNPGPPDPVFTFRYQYLLIEGGTNLLRNVFDHQVGSDFKQYLDNHHASKKQLLFLINNKKLTTVQQQLIPPVDNSPSSANFDITLLCCLLRNAGGLRVYSDTVWINPSPADTSVEALITRLKSCRNSLVHSGSVFDSETDLKIKWAELCSILTGLGNFCGMANVQPLIDKAETVVIDEKLKEQFDNMMSAWTEMDRLFDRGLAEVVSKVDQCVEGQKKLEQKINTVIEEQQRTNVRCDNIENNQLDDAAMKDVHQELIDVYHSDCFTLPMSPLIKDENQELLNIYKFPRLSVVENDKHKPDQEGTEFESCKDIFYQDQNSYRNIYITGDAGVGKSSLCMYMSMLWSMSHKGNKLTQTFTRMQEDAAFLSKFDYVFYVRLRDTDRTDVIAIIVDQLFSTESEVKWNKMYELVDIILKKQDSLVIIDGLDEWPPNLTGETDYKIPFRPTSQKCTYVTLCRPYLIENVVHEDIDRLVNMTGLHRSSMLYVAEIVSHVNQKYRLNKDAARFIAEAKQCGLHELLCIPLVAPNLVYVWLEQPLISMSRSRLYGNIVEMLFRIAKDGNVELPSSFSSTSAGVRLPDSLADLGYFKEHFALLDTVCLLSFRSLFKQDNCVTNLVFTPQQLMSNPYCLSPNEMNSLCQIGILSKIKVSRRFGIHEDKVNFLHLSYLEFFAAIFVSSFDETKLLDTFKHLTSINDVLQFENLFLFLAGLSPRTLESVLKQIYKSIGDELTICRVNAIFHYNSQLYQTQIRSLQKTVINCFKEGRKLSSAVTLKHEHFIFDDSFDIVYVKRLLALNNVKSIHLCNGEYLDELEGINHLQSLHIGGKTSADYEYDAQLTMLIDCNASTLDTLCIEGYDRNVTFIPELPMKNVNVKSFFLSLVKMQSVRSFNHLTSLSLVYLKMQHQSLHNLMVFMCGNINMKNIKLSCVSCECHGRRYNDCILILNLANHSKLTSLYLRDVNVLCDNVNSSTLRFITMLPFTERIASSYISLLKCIYSSQVEHLVTNGGSMKKYWLENTYSDGDYMLDGATMDTFATTVKTLSCLRSLKLEYMYFPEDVLLRLHTSVQQVDIELEFITMRRQCFQSFVDSFVNKTPVKHVKVELFGCQIITIDGETNCKLTKHDSVDNMSEILASVSGINITLKDDQWLKFESSQ